MVTRTCTSRIAGRSEGTHKLTAGVGSIKKMPFEELIGDSNEDTMDNIQVPSTTTTTAVGVSGGLANSHGE